MDPRINYRQQYEQREAQMLSPLACTAASSKGRRVSEPPCPLRTAFQRDRDRIVHCKAFRRLKHKTQVFISPEGDHYRTRLTHTLEVAQIARTIARALRLNEDLTEAVALGHDLGHTPFGHAGEKGLSLLMPGGFRHYEQSVRVVEQLEANGAGLNLSVEVLDGILCHTKGVPASTLEGQLVRFADRIAYVHHDMDDAIRAGVLDEGQLPPSLFDAFGKERRSWLGRLVTAVIDYSEVHGAIGFDDDTAAAFTILHDFMFDAVYTNPTAKSEESKVDGLIARLFEHLITHPDRLPPETLQLAERDGMERVVCDYIAGMSDNFAVETFETLFIPKRWTIGKGGGTD